MSSTSYTVSSEGTNGQRHTGTQGRRDRHRGNRIRAHMDREKYRGTDTDLEEKDIGTEDQRATKTRPKAEHAQNLLYEERRRTDTKYIHSQDRGKHEE